MAEERTPEHDATPALWEQLGKKTESIQEKFTNWFYQDYNNMEHQALTGNDEKDRKILTPEMDESLKNRLMGNEARGLLPKETLKDIAYELQEEFTSRLSLGIITEDAARDIMKVAAQCFEEDSKVSILNNNNVIFIETKGNDTFSNTLMCNLDVFPPKFEVASPREYTHAVADLQFGEGIPPLPVTKKQLETFLQAENRLPHGSLTFMQNESVKSVTQVTPREGMEDLCKDMVDRMGEKTTWAKLSSKCRKLASVTLDKALEKTGLKALWEIDKPEEEKALSTKQGITRQIRSTTDDSFLGMDSGQSVFTSKNNENKVPQEADRENYSCKIDKEGKALYYSPSDKKEAAFIDQGTKIIVTRDTDREATLAAFKLASEKWGEVQINGSEEHKKLCVELAVEHDLKIANPELQAEVEKLRAIKIKEEEKLQEKEILTFSQTPEGAKQALEMEAKKHVSEDVKVYLTRLGETYNGQIVAQTNANEPGKNEPGKVMPGGDGFVLDASIAGTSIARIINKSNFHSRDKEFIEKNLQENKPLKVTLHVSSRVNEKINVDYRSQENKKDTKSQGKDLGR